MSVKILLVLAVILLQFGILTAGEKYSDMYPNVSSCYEGTNQEPREFMVNMHLNAKAKCTNGNNPEENSLCYKVCVINERHIMRKDLYPDMNDLYRELSDQADFSGGFEAAWAKIEEQVQEQRTGYTYRLLGSSSAEALDLYAYEVSESVQEKLGQAIERLDECQPLHYMIPKTDEKDCEDLDPKYHAENYNLY